jgi:hypothetical protein
MHSECFSEGEVKKMGIKALFIKSILIRDLAEMLREVLD